MRQITHVDITHYSFDKFVDFLFNCDVSPEIDMPLKSKERPLPWYYRTKATLNLEKISSYYVRLFIQPAFLLERFSKAQLKQGFSAIQSGCAFSVKTLIWDKDLAFDRRAACVSSMFYLFKEFFSAEPLGHTANMWWDGLCYCWEIGQRQRSRGGEDAAMQDVMFVTMSEILAIDSQECRYSALHGLSHLHHPATLELIERYKSSITGLKTWCDEYAAEEAAWEARINSEHFPS